MISTIATSSSASIRHANGSSAFAVRHPDRSLLTAALFAVVLTVLILPVAAQVPKQLPDPDKRPPAAKPVKVFIMTGQCNMLGFGRIDAETTKGTLAYLCKEQGKYSHLVDRDGKWTVRNDVWCAKTTNRQKQGWLQPGFGARGGLIGPELQFGHIMGYIHDEPVLIIKASQGNRSLGWDILPPGSERFEFGGRIYAGYKDTTVSWLSGQLKEPVDWYAGKQYDDYVKDIKEVLDNLPKFFPSHADRGYKLAGFVWWQGLKDQNAAHASRYEFNLVNLIKSLRREFKAPGVPFVIGTIAFGGEALSGHGLTVVNAQLAVSGDKGKYSEFIGNVQTVDTRSFWRDRSVSPNGNSHQYNQNAETFIEVGDALGRAMAKLLKNGSSQRGALAGVKPVKSAKENNKAKKAVKPAPAPAPDPAEVAKALLEKRKALQTKIDTAVGRGVEWLIARQISDGSWTSTIGSYPSGQTALSLYSLLKSGLPPSQTNVSRGFRYLLRRDPQKVYSIGCELMALEATGDKSYKPRIKKLLKRLVKWQQGDGGWSYGAGGHTDMSNTQYAALGLRAAMLAGFKIPPATLGSLVSYARRHQTSTLLIMLPAKDGYAAQPGRAAGFVYRAPGKPTGSMTTAGIGVLAIARDCYGRRRVQRFSSQIDRGIDWGLNWLRLHWTVAGNPNHGRSQHLYYLYGLERVGGLLQKEIVAGHPWYTDGSHVLLKQQDRDGGWNRGSESDTCFALLFFQRATWNRRSRSSGSYKSMAHNASSKDVLVRGSGDRILAVWIRGFSPKTIERFKLGRSDSGIRVYKVEYLIGNSVFATVMGDMSRPWKAESYAVNHEFKHNGGYDISVRVHVLPPGETTHNADTKLEVFSSNSFNVKVLSVEDPLHADIEKALEQQLFQGARMKTRVSSGEKEARFVVDGLMGTAWLSKSEDEKPTFELDMIGYVTGRYFIMSLAEKGGEIESIEFRLKGIKKPWIAKPEFGRRAVRFDIGKRRRIKGLVIKINKKKPNSRVGLAELLLYK